MSALSELNTLLDDMGISHETGVYTETAPDCYIVMVPIGDTFNLHADNCPGGEVQEIRLSLYCKGNYNVIKNLLVKDLLIRDFTITDRRYLGYETDTGYHHYAVDVAKHYEL